LLNGYYDAETKVYASSSELDNVSQDMVDWLQLKWDWIFFKSFCWQTESMLCC